MDNLPKAKTFEKVAVKVSKVVGSPVWFILSLLLVILWLPSRIFFESDELWHLNINTITTILTFLMMSLLHASQTRWEKRMENLENDQKKALRLIETKTEEIAKSVETSTIAHSLAHVENHNKEVTKLF